MHYLTRLAAILVLNLAATVASGQSYTMPAGGEWSFTNADEAPLNGENGPASLKHITWAGGGGNLCWVVTKNGVPTGKTSCSLLVGRTCRGAPCDTSKNQLCMPTPQQSSGATALTLSSQGPASCQTYVPATVYQTDVAGHLKRAAISPGTMLPWPFNCTIGKDCDAVNNTSAQLNGVLFRTNEQLPKGSPLKLDGLDCQHMVNCIGAANGRVLPYGPKGAGALMMPDWAQLPGQAQAVAVGTNGALWAVASNRSIWRWSAAGWAQIPGAADRIAVDPAGNAWVVDLTSSKLHRWTGGSWAEQTGAKFRDVAISREGQVFVTDDQKRLLTGNGSSWTPMDGQPVRVAVSTSGVVFVINDQGQIWRRTNGQWQQLALPAGKYAISLAAGGDQLYAVVGNAVNATTGVFARLDGAAWNMVMGQQLGLVAAVAANARGEPMVTTHAGAVWRWGF